MDSVDVVAAVVTTTLCLATEFVRYDEDLTTDLLAVILMILVVAHTGSSTPSRVLTTTPAFFSQLAKYCAKKGILSSAWARKLMHMGIGPVFLLCWPLFGSSPWSPYIAASIPGVMTLKFAAIGTGEILRNAVLWGSLINCGQVAATELS